MVVTFVRLAGDWTAVIFKLTLLWRLYFSFNKPLLLERSMEYQLKYITLQNNFSLKIATEPVLSTQYQSYHLLCYRRRNVLAVAGKRHAIMLIRTHTINIFLITGLCLKFIS